MIEFDKPKRPDETVTASYDFRPRLATNETLSSPSVTATAGVTISNVTISGKKVVCLIAGGTHANDYTVTFSVNTSANQVLKDDVTLKVRNDPTA